MRPPPWEQDVQITPGMTVFGGVGGRVNEGRLQVDGIGVGASVNGGGVSGCVADVINWLVPTRVLSPRSATFSATSTSNVSGVSRARGAVAPPGRLPSSLPSHTPPGGSHRTAPAER